MNVRSLSVAISFNGSDVVVLPPQTQLAANASQFPSSSGEYTSISSSSSSFYDESAPLLSPMRYTRPCRAAMTWQQAQDIRSMHSSSMDAMKAGLQYRVPHVEYRGGSPIFSYHSSPRPTVPQPPVPQTDDALLDEIYSGYHHITTLDLDDVANLSDLRTPIQPPRKGNPDTSAQSYMKHGFFHGFFDFELSEPAPLMPDIWIDPYGLPSGSHAEHLVVTNVDPDSEGYPNACYILANSGLNFLTDYPVSDSPRKCVFEISAILRRHSLWTPQWEETISVGHVFSWPSVLTKVRTRDSLFSRFSYTSQVQPRTEHARATEGEPRSPRSTSPGFGVLFEA